MADRSTPRFFISYAHADRASADRLIGDLQARGVGCWIDEQNLQPGTPNWELALRTAIRAAQGVILISSPNVLASRYVTDELRVAEMYQRTVYPFPRPGCGARSSTCATAAIASVSGRLRRGPAMAITGH